MLALKILWGVLSVACIGGTIWLLIIGLWQAAIPLAAIGALFSYMTARDIIQAIKEG